MNTTPDPHAPPNEFSAYPEWLADKKEIASLRAELGNANWAMEGLRRELAEAKAQNNQAERLT